MTGTLVLAAAGHADNSTWHQFTTWLTTGSNWWSGNPNGTPGAVHLLIRHVWICALSLGITCALAMPLALLLSRFRRGGFLVTSIGNAARSVPIVGVMLLLATGAIGEGLTPAIIALVIFAIPPILTNTFTGLTEVDPEITRAAFGMGMTRWEVLRQVEVPLAIPLIATGLRLAAVQIWATATIAAIIGSGGLGELVTVGYSTQAYGEVYGGVLVTAVTAVLLDTMLVRVQDRVRAKYGAAPAEVL